MKPTTVLVVVLVAVLIALVAYWFSLKKESKTDDKQTPSKQGPPEYLQGDLNLDGIVNEFDNQ